MQKIAQGDENALRVLMRAHLARTVRLAQRILGDAAAAEDVAQEAFIRVWKNAARFETPEERGARFTTWLHKIVVNLCIDEKRKARPQALDDLPEPGDGKPGAEEILQRNERAQDVRRALARLPERQRAAFILSFYEEYSNKEAAGMLGISVKALESLLVRARRVLREELKEETFKEAIGS